MADRKDDKSQEQFIRLLMTNENSIYAYILSFVPNSNDADDLMQETSAVLWQKFSEFEPDRPFIAWAITIARYQVMKYFKTRKRSKVVFSEDLINYINAEVEKKLPSMDPRIDALEKCVNKLNSKDQWLLKLRYGKGYTFENIGAHISKSTRATFYSLSRIHHIVFLCIKQTLGSELSDESAK